MNGGIGSQEMPMALLLGQIEKAFLRHLGVERRAFFFPVGDQFVQRDGIDDGARKNMGADLGPLFDQRDGAFLLRGSRELFQPDRRGQARRPAADDDDVVFHAFAGGGIGHRAHYARAVSEPEIEDVGIEGLVVLVAQKFVQVGPRLHLRHHLVLRTRRDLIAFSPSMAAPIASRSSVTG